MRARCRPPCGRPRVARPPAADGACARRPARTRARGGLRRALGGLALAAATVVAGLWGTAVAQEIVAARTLRPGTVLTAEDLVVRGPAAGGAAATDDAARAAIAALVGREARVAIYAGRPVRPGDVGPPTLVRRNAVVVMHYRRGSLAIRAGGRALAAGGAGERIRVLNLTSRRAVEAVVIGKNEVEVRP